MTDVTSMLGFDPDCVFCERIRKHEYDSFNEHAVSFAPLNPVTEGHLLIVPRLHVHNAAEVPKITGKAFEYASYLGSWLPEGFNLITSAGKNATQTVFHLHIHLIPRFKDDGLALPWTGQDKKESVT